RRRRLLFRLTGGGDRGAGRRTLPVLAAAQEAEHAALDAQLVLALENDAPGVDFAVLRVVDLAVPAIGLGLLHGKQDLHADDRTVAFGRIRIVLVLAGILGRGNEAAHRLLAAGLDPNRARLALDVPQPFGVRLGLRGKTGEPDQGEKNLSHPLLPYIVW